MNRLVFILCYACDDRKSFDNLKEIWIPKVYEINKSPLIVICGNKLNAYDEDDKDHVSPEEAKSLAKTLGKKSAIDVRCSARKSEKNVSEYVDVTKVFDNAIRLYLLDSKHEAKKWIYSSVCTLF